MTDSAPPTVAAESGAVVTVPRAITVAAGIVLLQAAGLVAIAAILVGKTIFGHPDSLGRSLLGAALAVLAALTLAGCARGLLGLRFWARTPIVVLELLAVPVGYSLGIQSHRIGYGGPVLVGALAALYLVFTPPARAALDREI